MLRPLTGALLLACLASCAHGPFPEPPGVEVEPGLGAGALVRAYWPPPGGVFRVKQTAVLEIRGSRMPMLGVMELDTRTPRARLVALNDLGVKLLDITVTPSDTRAHYVLPGLDRQAGLVDVVAESLRRVYLTPPPAPEDSPAETPTRYRTLRRGTGMDLRYTFRGDPLRLYEKAAGPWGEGWTARFYEYRGTAHPGGIVLHDTLAPYRLTLWLDEVRMIDE